MILLALELIRHLADQPRQSLLKELLARLHHRAECSSLLANLLLQPVDSPIEATILAIGPVCSSLELDMIPPKGLDDPGQFAQLRVTFFAPLSNDHDLASLIADPPLHRLTVANELGKSRIQSSQSSMHLLNGLMGKIDSDSNFFELLTKRIL